MTPSSDDAAADYAVGASQYAVEVVEALWPSPWRVHSTGRPSSRGERALYVFPGRRRPRVLVPVDVPAAASMLLRLGSGRSPYSSTARVVLARAARSPLFRHLRWPALQLSAPGSSDAESIETFLSRRLGQEIRVGIVLGVPRANRKPVLQMFGADGKIAGFAKVGHNSLTASLVRREADALALLNSHQTMFQAPRLLLHEEWNGLQVVAMSPLLGAAGVEADPSLRLTAMREVAALNGVRTALLSRSSLWERLAARRSALRDPDTVRRLEHAMAQLVQRWGDHELELGAWHGDWGHWNMALDGDVVQIWDWERFDTDVPVGFDALHYEAQGVRPENREFADQQQRFLQSVPDVLAQFGQPRAGSDVVLALYLVEMSIRYAEALSHAKTPRLKGRSEWAMHTLEEIVSGATAPLRREGAS